MLQNLLKPITINGQQYHYRVTSDADGYATQFYKGTHMVPKYQFLGWKSKKMVERPRYLFTIWGNIENPKVTKRQLQIVIDKALLLYARSEEIKRGEIL